MSPWSMILQKYGYEYIQHLAPVVERLMMYHETSGASERNWLMWGRVYSASRNALGMEQAKKLIAICTNTK